MTSSTSIASSSLHCGLAPSSCAEALAFPLPSPSTALPVDCCPPVAPLAWAAAAAAAAPPLSAACDVPFGPSTAGGPPVMLPGSSLAAASSPPRGAVGGEGVEVVEVGVAVRSPGPWPSCCWALAAVLGTAWPSGFGGDGSWPHNTCSIWTTDASCAASCGSTPGRDARRWMMSTIRCHAPCSSTGWPCACSAAP